MHCFCKFFVLFNHLKYFCPAPTVSLEMEYMLLIVFFRFKLYATDATSYHVYHFLSLFMWALFARFFSTPVTLTFSCPSIRIAVWTAAIPLTRLTISYSNHLLTLGLSPLAHVYLHTLSYLKTYIMVFLSVHALTVHNILLLCNGLIFQMWTKPCCRCGLHRWCR